MARRTAARAVRLPADHPPVAAGRIGVLLVNLGTPEGTSYWPMRRYLSQFLSDRRVIEWPRIVWQPILQVIVLSVRPKKSGHKRASSQKSDGNNNNYPKARRRRPSRKRAGRKRKE